MKTQTNTPTESFSIKAIVLQSYEIFKQNWKFLAKCSFVIIAFQIFMTGFEEILKVVGRNFDLLFKTSPINTYNPLLFSIVAILVITSCYVGAVLEIGMIRIILGVIRKQQNLQVKQLFNREPLKFYLKYYAVSFLYSGLVFVGIILLVIPGIYWAIKYSYADIIFLDQKTGIKEAFTKSAKLTEGVKWKMVTFALALAGINILGALALLVGLFITIPVTALASFVLYQHLKEKRD